MGSLSLQDKKDMLTYCSQNVTVLYNDRTFQDKSFFNKLNREDIVGLINRDAGADAAIREDIGEQTLIEIERNEKAERFL